MKIFNNMISSAISERDRANMVWLADRVDERGWPSIAMVGEEASHSAWLLAQHADADPAFQLMILRKMEPLAKRGQVKARDFAMLTDRVQLRLTRTQKYGTQWMCEDGIRQPQPLMHDRAETDRLRAAMDLDTLAENAARMNENHGPCRTD